MPALVQGALALTLGAIGVLVLSRSHGTHDQEATDVRAASVAAEYVALMTLIWVAFQAYAAIALVTMWEREQRGLGWQYAYVEVFGLLLTLVVATRAARSSAGRPSVLSWPSTGDSGSSTRIRRSGVVCADQRRPPLDAQFRQAGRGAPDGRHPDDRDYRPDHHPRIAPQINIDQSLTLRAKLGRNIGRGPGFSSATGIPCATYKRTTFSNGYKRATTGAGDLADAYSARIYQLAFRYLRNKEDAEEVTQDVLFKVYRNIGSFRGDSALSSWIYRITFNAAMSRLRTARYQHVAGQRTRTSRRPTAKNTTRRARDVADWSDMADEHLCGRSFVGACSARSSRFPPSIARRSCSATFRACRPKRRARCCA